MNSTGTRGLRIFHQLHSLKLISSRTFFSTSQPTEHFSRDAATVSLLCCPQCSKKAGLASIYSSRTIRTSSLKRACSDFNDAFSETNKVRLVQQLGGMKTRKSLLASCSEEAAVFVPFCIVDSVPSVLFTLRSNQLNKHRGEVRSVLYFKLINYSNLNKNKLQYSERKPHWSWLVFKQGIYRGQIWNRKCWFCGRRKTGELETLGARREPTTNSTQPTYGTGTKSIPSHIRVEQALSPVRQPLIWKNLVLPRSAFLQVALLILGLSCKICLF